VPFTERVNKQAEPMLGK